MAAGTAQDKFALHKNIIQKNEAEVERLLKNPSVDVSIQDDTEEGNTPLHYAASTGCLKIVRMLLEKNSKTVNKVNKRGRTPLHLAAEHDEVMVAEMLMDKQDDINLQDTAKFTPLLTAAKYNSPQVVHVLLEKEAKTDVRGEKGKSVFHYATENNNKDVLEILLKYDEEATFRLTEIKKLLDMADDDERTPLHVAAHNGYLQCLNILIKNGAGVFHTCKGKKTVLHLAAAEGWTDIVAQLLKSWKGLVSLTDIDGRTALHDAVIHNQKKVVEILIQAGASVNALDTDNSTPISFAAEQGLVKCTRLLLSNDAHINLEGIEKEETRKNMMTPVQVAAVNGHSEVVHILVTEKNADLTRRSIDHDKGNCLDLAIDNNHVDTVFTIIKSDKWEDVLRNQTSEFQSPMRKLISNMPDAAKEVFDRCTQTRVIDKEFEVQFNYEFLDDTLLLGKWKETDGKQKSQEEKPYTRDSVLIKNNHPLMLMVTSERKELLDHPLVSALLKKKWTNVGLICHLLNFLLYALYLAMLTGFALDVKAPFQFTNISSAVCSDHATRYKIPEFAAVAKYFVILIAVVELFIEILEVKLIFSCKVWYYFMEKENVLEWITCITSILFVMNTSGCSDTGYRPQWQWTCGTISVFLAWINLLFLIQKFEWVGIYVVMLYSIVKVFVKFFLVFSLLIVAFAVSFHCLFRNQENFGTFWISLVKTTAMMIGELDFSTTFLDGEVYFDVISYVFFYGFMLFMSIVVINLLVGLAVENIQEFHTRAGLTKKEMQVKFALELERLATSPTFRKGLTFLFCNRKVCACTLGETKEVINPNKQNWLQRKFGQSWKLTSRDIEAALNTEKEDTSREIARLDMKVKTAETKLKAKMKIMDSKLTEIVNTLRRLEDKTSEQ
ncbi:transient receptor potential cation channel subfamily A member 1-like isoform X2 [Mercenaria mercenaria]|nr:transient receptor potential cation channel subfamily A member 1-like isoform X2 [Mercenaria mercenaria]